MGRAVNTVHRRRLAARWLALPVLLAVAGCVRLDAPPPAAGIPVPERWAETQTAPLTSDVGTYWRQLDDPLLTQFVEQAIANNLDLAQSAARLEQARAQLASARAAFFPQVSGSAGASKDVGDFAQKRLNFNAGLDASWEADLFGQISGNVAASKADLAAAGYSLADLQRVIVGQVALTTIQARATALQLAIARDTLKYQEDNLQIARWRVQAGLVSSLDVEQARSQRAATAATIPLLESNLAASANAISTLIGEPPGRVLGLLQGSELMPTPPAA
jgi:outer membrane protein TolC